MNSALQGWRFSNICRKPVLSVCEQVSNVLYKILIKIWLLLEMCRFLMCKFNKLLNAILVTLFTFLLKPHLLHDREGEKGSPFYLYCGFEWPENQEINICYANLFHISALSKLLLCLKYWLILLFMQAGFFLWYCSSS